MTDILKAILANKHAEIEVIRRRRPLTEVQAAAALAPAPRDMLSALRPTASPRIIAECKRMSPSRGIMIKDYDPVALARAYAAGGAAAISVLTDEKFFGGDLAHLAAVRQAVSVPVLRKDFIVDPYQVWEARAAGADSFLLLSGVLSPERLEPLLRLGRSLGMEPLIESHTEDELDQAMSTAGEIFGVNNRDLKSFTIDLATARKLLSSARRARPAALMVCESGIRQPEDIRAMVSAGYNIFLVGEALATAGNPEASLRALIQATP